MNWSTGTFFEDHIEESIEKYKLGSIKRVDITGYGSRRRAFIHFNFWNINFYYNTEIKESLFCSIIYNYFIYNYIISFMEGLVNY